MVLTGEMYCVRQVVSTKADHIAEGVQRVAGVLDAGRFFFKPGCVRSESFSERELWEEDTPRSRS